MYPDLDNAVVGQVEEAGSVRRIAVHERKQMLTPLRHRGQLGDHHRLLTDEVGGVGRVEAERRVDDVAQRLRDGRLLHEAIGQHDLIEALTEGVDGRSLGLGLTGASGGADAHDGDRLVQHLVVLQIGEQGRRRRTRLSEQIDTGSRDPHLRMLGDRLDEALNRDLSLPDLARGDLTSCLPGGHDREANDGNHQREPASRRDLRDVGSEEGEVEDQEEPGEGVDGRRPPSPMAPHHPVQQERGDDHVRRHSDAVRGRQSTGRPEAEYQADCSHHEKPVDPGHIDLADLPRGGVVHLLAGQEAQLDRLSRERVGARDQGL